MKPHGKLNYFTTRKTNYICRDCSPAGATPPNATSRAEGSPGGTDSTRRPPRRLPPGPRARSAPHLAAPPAAGPTRGPGSGPPRQAPRRHLGGGGREAPAAILGPGLGLGRPSLRRGEGRPRPPGRGEGGSGPALGGTTQSNATLGFAPPGRLVLKPAVGKPKPRSRRPAPPRCAAACEKQRAVPAGCVGYKHCRSATCRCLASGAALASVLRCAVGDLLFRYASRFASAALGERIMLETQIPL